MSMSIESKLPPQLADRARRLSTAVATLVIDAFDEGRATALAHERRRFDSVCTSMLRELERAFDGLSPDDVARIEDNYRSAVPSAVVAAHLGAPAAVLMQVREAMERSEEEDPCAPGTAP